MHLVEVAVSKNAKVQSGAIPTLALQLGKREDKIPAQLFAPDLGRVRGKRIVCIARPGQVRTARGESAFGVVLQATKRRVATHGTPIWKDGQIDFPELQF